MLFAAIACYMMVLILIVYSSQKWIFKSLYCKYIKLSPSLTFIFEEDVVDPNINKIQPKQNNPTISKQKISIIF